MTCEIYGLWEEEVCNLWIVRKGRMQFMAYEMMKYVIYGLWEDDVCNLWLMRRWRM